MAEEENIMAIPRDLYFTVLEELPSHNVSFSQEAYTGAMAAVNAAKAGWAQMKLEDKQRNIAAVYGWLGKNGEYNPNTADTWEDPDVVINIAYGPHEGRR